jgi:ATP-dependent Clp protease ATP-binding subunit ClpC
MSEKNKIKFGPLPERMICSQVGRDLTYLAQENPYGHLEGREQEIEQIKALLCRHGLKNFIVIGESGVGKSVLVRELALCISEGNVPERIRTCRVIQTSFADLWAYTGDSMNWAKYLNHLRDLLSECRDFSAILFMDEIHTIWGHSYSLNVLKPYLSDGSVTIVGATTTQEYYTYIDQDKALSRRFHLLHLPEPKAQATSNIIQKWLIKNEPTCSLGSEPQDQIDYLIQLTNAYIPYQFQPAKSIDLIERIVVEKNIKNEELIINRNDIRHAVCQAIGLPDEAIESPKQRLEAMENVLNARILGQEQAISALCRRLFISKSSLSVTPNRPHGVFLLAGPSGVGKTELAKVLAEYLTGDEGGLIRLDMNSYTEAGAVYTLLGVPGRNSNEEIQQLPTFTKRMKARPYSVLLLDEIEKAHPSIRLLFLHAFDTGKMTDNLGNEIYLKNTVIIITSNLGFSVRKAVIQLPGGDSATKDRDNEKATLDMIKKNFPKEFLGRIDDIIMFKPLTQEIMKGFVRQKLQILENISKKKIIISDAAVMTLCEKGFHPEYGARDLNRAVDDLLGYPLAILKHSVDWDEVHELHVERNPDGELTVHV